MNQQTIVRRPNPGPQTAFLSCSADIVIYGGAAGGGKALALDTPIPTPTGWTAMGALRVGDIVFSEDGTPTRVTAVHAVRTSPALAVVFDDGVEIVCDAEHLWRVSGAHERGSRGRKTDEARAARRASRPSRAKGKRPDVIARNAARAAQMRALPPLEKAPRLLNTQQLREGLRVGVTGRTNYAVDVASPIACPQRALTVDPYVLGAWLGDGHTDSGCITNATADKEIIAHCALHHSVTAQQSTLKNKAPVYRLAGLTALLRGLGVLGNKHIPMVYLRASFEQRLALLQGLMDTDGGAESGGCAFTTTCAALRDSMYELLCSLGIKASFSERRATLYGKDCGPKWVAKFNTTLPVFRLARKAAKQHVPSRGVHARRYIVDVREVGPRDVRCIAVEHPSGMFLCGRAMVPTHNTFAIGLEGLRHAPTVPGFVAVYLRREQVDIKQKGGLLDAVKALWVPRGARLNHTTLTFTWPNGGAIQLGSAQREDDVHKFDGSEICGLVFDEVQHFEESQFWYLLSRNRSSCGVRPYVRGTCNPSADSWLASFLAWWIDEEGFAIPERSGVIRWMVRRGDVVHWADTPAELHEQFPTTEEQRARGEQGCYPKSVSFIAAKLSDNPKINREYIANLDNLPRVERARLLGGNWKVRPAAGDYFPRGAAPIVDAVDQSAIIKRVRHWDLAASEPSEVNPDPDYTAGVLVGQYRDGRWVVLDVIAGRWRAHKVEELIRKTAESDGRGVQISLPQDPGQAGKSQVASLIKLLAGYRATASRESGDKETRAVMCAAQWQAGNIDVVRAGWNESFLTELDAFPRKGVHDDRVDAFAGAFNLCIQGSAFMANFRK